MISRVPLRLRVALAFALTTGVALTGLGAFVLVRVEDTLRDQAEQALRTQMEALSSLPIEQRMRAVPELTGITFAQVLSSEGDLVASSPQLDAAVVDAADVRGAQPRERLVRLANDDEAEPALVLSRRLGGQVLMVGRSLEPVEEALDGVLSQFLIGVPLALLVASAAGYAVAGAALGTVERLRRQAATISALDPRTRLPLPAAHDEMYRLGTTLNAMLDRLEAAAARERDFVAEASHELRTPLALLRTELDLALAQPRSREEMLTALRSASEEVERLTALAEDLLLLADSADGSAALDDVEVPVDAFLDEVAGRYSGLAGSEGRRIVVEAGEGLTVRGDRDRLARALGNLVHNALLHGDGVVTVRARGEGQWVVLDVEDEGPGVAPDLRARVFERFTRAPTSRASHSHGLGLAITRVIVEEHRGLVQILGGQDSGRSVVSVRLPVGGPR